MSIFADVVTERRELVGLPAGSYGTGKSPGLKIQQYIEKSSKLDKSGAMRHSFLVVATRPSREAIAVATDPREVDYEGSAFLSLTLHPMALTPESVALAFSGENMDYVAKAIANGDCTQESIDNCKVYWRQVATNKVLEANTPPEQMEEAIQTQYQKELMQIQIKVGTFHRLQLWAGLVPDLQLDPRKLEGLEFSGKIETREFNNKTQSEVTQVYGKK